MASAASQFPVWVADRREPGSLFRRLFGFAFGISFIVFVEPAPVDALLLALLAIGLCIGVVRLTRLPMLPVVLLAGFALANLISMAGADDSTRAIFYAFVTLYMLGAWLLFVGVIDHYGYSAIKSALFGYAIAVELAVIPALASYFHVIGFQSIFLLFGRPRGTFKDPNVFGPFSVILGVMAVTGCLPIRSRAARLILGVVASLGVVFSYSRAAWINYAVSLILFVAFDQLLPCRTATGRTTSLKQIVGFTGVVVLAIAFVTQIPVVKTMLAVRLGQGGMQNYDEIRFQTQAMAVRAAIDHPFGIGPGQSEETFTYATHSSYVRVLGENGLFGLFCFVGFLIATLIKAVMQAGTASSPQWRNLYLASAACIGGLLINSAVVDTVHWRHLWFLLALPWAPNSVGTAQRAEGQLSI